MNKESRMEKAQDRALERLDYVMGCHEASDFVEVQAGWVATRLLARFMIMAACMKDRRKKTMRYDARTEYWIPMEVKGVKGYFNDMRIDRGTVPDGFHMWELRMATAMAPHADISRASSLIFMAHLSQRGNCPLIFQSIRKDLSIQTMSGGLRA